MMTIIPEIPDWLKDKVPAAVKIWEATIVRLERSGRLGSTDPEIAEMVSAYAYCMAQAAYFETVDPKLIKWIGSIPPADHTYHEPRWIREAREAGGNPLVYLWIRAAKYAGNRLGLFGPAKHISYWEIYFEDGWDELDHEGHLVYAHGGMVTAHLDPTWQFGED